jgi:hypothetical protein
MLMKFTPRPPDVFARGASPVKVRYHPDARSCSSEPGATRPCAGFLSGFRVFDSVGSFRFEPRLSAENRHKVGLHGKRVAKISAVANDPMGSGLGVNMNTLT